MLCSSLSSTNMIPAPSGSMYCDGLPSLQYRIEHCLTTPMLPVHPPGPCSYPEQTWWSLRKWVNIASSRHDELAGTWIMWQSCHWPSWPVRVSDYRSSSQVSDRCLWDLNLQPSSSRVQCWVLLRDIWSHREPWDCNPTDNRHPQGYEVKWNSIKIRLEEH